MWSSESFMGSADAPAAALIATEVEGVMAGPPSQPIKSSM